MSKDNIIQFPTSKIKDDHQKDIDDTSWWLDLDLSNVPSDEAEVILVLTQEMWTIQKMMSSK